MNKNLSALKHKIYKYKTSLQFRGLVYMAAKKFSREHNNSKN